MQITFFLSVSVSLGVSFFCLSVSNSTMCTLEPSYDPSYPVSCRPYQPPLIRSPRKQTGRPTYRTHTASRLLRLVINYREGVYQMGKSQVRNFLRLTLPPPSRQGKTLCAPPPPFKEWKLFEPPFNMAKTSSYHVKTTPKPFVPPPPPSAWLKIHMLPPPS